MNPPQCLDVLVARQVLKPAEVVEGKAILVGVVSLVSGLIARFSGEVREEGAGYGAAAREKEND